MIGGTSDAQLQREVLDALRYDVRIDETNITVDVVNGGVRLSGTAPTYFQKITAGHDIQRIKGVREVVNDIEVSPVTAWTDVEVRRVIRATLDHDARLGDPSTIDVVVADGSVTLNGSVGSAAERAYAAGDAWVAPGVLDVINNLTITAAQKRSDSDVANDVRAELDRDVLLHATKINVRVTDGVVYLEGTVPSDFDAHEAQHDSWRVAGIREVVNDLRVAA